MVLSITSSAQALNEFQDEASENADNTEPQDQEDPDELEQDLECG